MTAAAADAAQTAAHSRVNGLNSSKSTADSYTQARVDSDKGRVAVLQMDALSQLFS